MPTVCKEVAKRGQLWAVVHGSRVLGLGGQTGLVSPAQAGTILALAQPDRAIACMDGKRLAPAIHLSVNLRVAEGSFDSDRDAQADVPVTGAGINIRLEIGWKYDIHAAVTRANRPA